MAAQSQAQRPRVFIGCSSKQLPVAKELQVLLDDTCEVEIWTQGLFAPGGSTLASLVKASRRFDCAVLVVSADDTTITHGKTKSTTRDNVIFELGLFMGVLGPDRTFMLRDGNAPLDLPTDLAGVTWQSYKPYSSGNLTAALGAAATQLEKAMLAAGPITPTMRVAAAVQESEQDDAASSAEPGDTPSPGAGSGLAEEIVDRWLQRNPAHRHSIETVVTGLQGLGYALTPSVPKNGGSPSQTYLRVLRRDGKNAGFLESTRFYFVGTAPLLEGVQVQQAKYPYVLWSDDGAVDLVLRLARRWQKA